MNELDFRLGVGLCLLALSCLVILVSPGLRVEFVDSLRSIAGKARPTRIDALVDPWHTVTQVSVTHAAQQRDPRASLVSSE